MATHSNLPAAFEFTFQVERLYAGLTRVALPDSVRDSEPSLGGKLLYAGQLDAEARALVVAANIAGAASLTSTADAAAQRQAIHDGVADFLVTSLDEALRILKNEIRKGETVAVCVAAAPEAMEHEILERGVLPDLLGTASSVAAGFARLLQPGVSRVEAVEASEGQVFIAWSVAAAPAIWLPKLDAIVLHCLSENSTQAAGAARRWLRLAPRYLGRLAPQGTRLLRCDEATARSFQQQLRASVERGEIPVPVELQSFSPAASIRAQSSFTP